MRRAVGKVGITGISTVIALCLSFTMIFLATYFSDAVSARDTINADVNLASKADVPSLSCKSLEEGNQTCEPVGAVYCETGEGKGCTYKLHCECKAAGTGNIYHQWVDSGVKCADMSQCPSGGSSSCTTEQCGSVNPPGPSANDNSGMQCFCNSFQCSTVNGSQCGFRCDDNCVSFTGTHGCDYDPRPANDRAVPLGCFARQIDYYPSGGYTLCPRTLFGADCEETPPPPPAEVNTPPACDALTVNKTNVTSLDEQITVTVKGSDPDNTPLKLDVYAAAAGQINRNPANFNCVTTPVTHPEYSFYCKGQSVWAQVGSGPDRTTHTFTTTYAQLASRINALNSGFTGNINELGIILSANITGSSSADICSSNISRNNGNGVYFNGGAWDKACNGGCNVTIKYTPPPPVNNPPICELMEVDKTVVKTMTEPIKVTLKGSDPDGIPQKLSLFAAAGGQINRNPANFNCVGAPSTHPEYSFYCRGTASWVQIGSKIDAKEVTITTNFQELMGMVKSLNSGFEGTLEENGIRISANITGSSAADICSSNISRNNGNGVYYNGGAWNQACQGGCNALVQYKPVAPPGEAKACNESCTSSSQCDGANQCINGSCRNPECSDQTDCTCKPKPEKPKSCNESCTTDSQCEGSNKCINGSCRNPQCDTETDCICATTPEAPRCGDNKCNQPSEMCENNISCINGASVACRNDCTYCGDGKVNGGEQCDFNAPGQAGNCSKQCKVIEHVPEDTAGGLDSGIAMISGLGMLTMGAGMVTLTVPMKKKVRFEMR